MTDSSPAANPAPARLSARPRLGRGLSSLMSPVVEPPVSVPPAAVVSTPPVTTVQASGKPLDVPVGDIAANPYQPRKEFLPQELDELAQSIRQQGILQPLVVARNESVGIDQPYVLIAGERRLRAARIVGMTSVPCIVRSATPQQMLELALIENIQRADLNPMEKARAYREYMDRFGLNVAQAAERLGQARPTVSNFLRLLDLETSVQAAVSCGQLSFGHAKVLATLANQPAEQAAMAQRAIAEALSVRQLELLVQGDKIASAQSTSAAAGESKLRIRPAYVKDLEEQLTRAVGTRVAIFPGRSKNSGKILIEYYGLDDFDRIAGMLGMSGAEAGQ